MNKKEVEYIDVSKVSKDEAEMLLRQIWDKMVRESKPLDSQFAAVLNENIQSLF